MKLTPIYSIFRAFCRPYMDGAKASRKEIFFSKRPSIAYHFIVHSNTTSGVLDQTRLDGVFLIHLTLTSSHSF